MSVIGSEATPPYRTVRAADHGWERMAPGVERKVLWVSGGAQSCMVRMAPGASVTAHSHAMDEECVVLEGTLHIGPDIVLNAGDFHVGRKGSTHELATTQTGALVVLEGLPHERLSLRVPFEIENDRRERGMGDRPHHDILEREVAGRAGEELGNEKIVELVVDVGQVVEQPGARARPRRCDARRVALPRLTAAGLRFQVFVSSAAITRGSGSGAAPSRVSTRGCAGWAPST